MDVRNHMYRATVVCRHSQIDQENLDLKIKKWKEESPDDNFFFRPYCLTSDSESYQQPQSLKEEDSTDVIKPATQTGFVSSIAHHFYLSPP